MCEYTGILYRSLQTYTDSWNLCIIMVQQKDISKQHLALGSLNGISAHTDCCQWNMQLFVVGCCSFHGLKVKKMPSVALCVVMYVLEWPFIVTSLESACAMYNQHLNLPHLYGELIILTKEKCSLTQIFKKFVLKISGKNPLCIQTKSYVLVLTLW